MDVVSTDEVPAEERFTYWREVNSKLFVPYDLRCDPEVRNGFRAHVGVSAFGPVRAALATMVPHTTHRTPRLIRRADPDVLEIGCTLHGAGTVTQDGRCAEVGAGDLVLLETSRPYRVDHAPHVPESKVLILHFPRSLLPFPAQDLRRLTAVRLSGDRSIGALTSQFLCHLARRMPNLSASETARLSTLTLDVLTTALADALDAENVLPPHTRQRALLARILVFIHHHLGDPRLTPEAIATAHHISPRYLHKVFEPEEHTVAGHIRHRRLENCRHDLGDPRLATRSIQTIAARWGFTSPAHFSQAFRAAYGLSPRQFRHQTLNPPAKPE
ncbi:helix-turn-helix domain-containing protein [Virgisporangium aurantiacum]|uniref:AraC family transcriptional regulator n=1 Tax=Virgisporangium aurantiacum TaxID=175570 RepID=A0A8J4E0K2_9ACTN|nr:helix-turn-helix domain-containing protein [Virgisporangium aurantiacum]GIJ56803.1 AraC family transcriptional regulator [Virgisporangium aurantiacum]